MSSSAMEAMDKLVQLAESMCQAASLLLGDNDPSDESSPRRPSTFLNAVALGNVVSQVGGASKLAVPRRPWRASSSPSTSSPRSQRRSRLCRVPASRRCPGGRTRILLAVDIVSSLTVVVASAVRVASCSHRVGRHRRSRRQAQIRPRQRRRRPRRGSAAGGGADGAAGEPLRWVVAAASVRFRPEVMDAAPPRLPPPRRLVLPSPRRRPPRRPPPHPPR
nr:uncharacterized protein LOC107279207 isoform X1 [Oryza sativa Japonica Group]